MAADKMTCKNCNDTHEVEFLNGRGEWVRQMCTYCPVPCQLCRQGGNGPYCASVPCKCACHGGVVATDEMTRAEALTVLEVIAHTYRTSGERDRADGMRNVAAAKSSRAQAIDIARDVLREAICAEIRGFTASIVEATGEDLRAQPVANPGIHVSADAVAIFWNTGEWYLEVEASKDGIDWFYRHTAQNVTAGEERIREITPELRGYLEMTNGAQPDAGEVELLRAKAAAWAAMRRGSVLPVVVPAELADAVERIERAGKVRDGS